MYRIIISLFSSLRLYYLRCVYFFRDRAFIKMYNLPKLSKNEMSIVKQTWPCLSLKRFDLIYLRMYKKEYGFDPYFICDYQMQQILKKTNLTIRVFALENKGMLDIYFDKLPLPEVFVRCISNVFYNKLMKVISIDEAIDILKQQEEFIIKPSIETSQGKGVKKIMVNKDSDKYLLELLSSYKSESGNFIVQEVLYQNAEIEKLNPSSLNTCRVTTIYINGKFDYSSILKVGKKGAIKDNWNCSYLIGMDKDGTLHGNGYDNKLNKIQTTDNGIKFEGMKVPHFVEMVEFAKEYHIKYFPNCGVVGWDIFIDRKDKVRIIEINLTNVGVVGEQLCSGTFFKEFRNEICSLWDE